MSEDDDLGIYVGLRLMPRIHRKVVELSDAHPERYKTPSHFVRCAIMRLIRNHEEGLIHAHQP